MKIDFGVIVVYTPLLWCLDMESLKVMLKSSIFLLLIVIIALKWIMPQGDSVIEDPDGTLIELVETHRCRSWKKIGWLVLGFTKTRPRKAITYLDD
jgi:hypothetical protein